MKPLLRNSSSDGLYWTCLKVSFIFIWLPEMIGMALQFSSCPFPVGICKVWDFSYMFSPVGAKILILILILLSVLYIFEKKMVLVSALLAFLSCIVISHHESNGVFYRATALTTVWAAQFLAYLIKEIKSDFNWTYYRQQYGVQLIAATYTLAAISKLAASGIGWVEEGASLVPIQILNNFSFRYFDTADEVFLKQGYNLAYFIIENKLFIQGLLASALLLELFCLAATLSPTVRIVYGIALWLMHYGIDYYMNIYIAGMVEPMIVFFINPLFYVVLLYRFLKGVFMPDK